MGTDGAMQRKFPEEVAVVLHINKIQIAECVQLIYSRHGSKEITDKKIPRQTYN